MNLLSTRIIGQLNITDGPAHILMVMSRIFVAIGILALLRTRLCVGNVYFAKHIRKLTMFIIGGVFVISLIRYLEGPTHELSAGGFLIPNVSSYFLIFYITISMLTSLTWVYMLLGGIPRNSSLFFKIKAYSLMLAALALGVGDSIYIASTTSWGSVLSSYVAGAGYVLAAAALIMPDLRAFILRR